MLAFNRWFKEHEQLVTLLDTTHLPVAATAVAVKKWLYQKNYGKELI
jgi:hypothetical protein